MNVYERIKSLADIHKVSLQKVAEDNGFSSNLMYRWQKTDPKAKDVAKIADYFHVSTDYLLGRPPVEHKEETDLDKLIDNAHSYDGKPITGHDRDLIKAYLQGLYADK